MFIVVTFAAVIRRSGRIVLCCATTGIAALQFFFGRTAHSLFCIPIDQDHDVLDGILIRSKLHKVLDRLRQNTNSRVELLRAADCIIWDEVCMINKHVFQAVELLLRTIMGNNLPWGGTMIVTLGDWRHHLV